MFALRCRRAATRPIRRIRGSLAPCWPHRRPNRAQEADQGAAGSRRAALEAPRGADARQLPHEQPEIGATDVHEQALQDVGMATQMHPTHPPGFVEMRVGTFQQLASLPQQLLPAGSPNPSAIGIHRLLGRRLPLPVTSPRGLVPRRNCGCPVRGMPPSSRYCDTPCRRPPP